MRFSITRAVLIAGAAALALAISEGSGEEPQRQEGGRATLSDIGTIAPTPSQPKLSPKLAALHQADAAMGQRGTRATKQTARYLPSTVRGSIEARLVRLDDSGDVQVYVERTAASDGELRASGLRIERVSDDGATVQGRVRVADLQAVASTPGVSVVREPDYAVRNAGPALTEGDAILSAATLRTTYGVDGTGVRVGVISDGLEGLLDAQASGDVPASVDFETCDMIGEAPPGEPEDPTDADAGAEGTAMLEIVHDLAPGAELWFGYFGFNVSSGTSLDFMAAVDCLAENTDVVVDDISFLNAGAYDGTSAISQNAAAELADASNPIRGYYNAVGNEAERHYAGTFVDTLFTLTDSAAVWAIHEWAGTSTTTDGGNGFQCGGDPADGYCGDTFIVEPDGFVVAWMQWDETWGAASSDYAVFFLVEGTGKIFKGDTLQSGTQNPRETLGWFNDTGETQFLDVIIGQRSGVPRTFDMFFSCGGCQPIDGLIHNFNTISGSVPNNSDAGGGVVSLGAVNADEPDNDLIAPYSSRGPTNDGRTKPDITAIDGVTVTGSGGFPNPFFGTSAAAPHAAGIAALILSCNASLLASTPGTPATERATLRDALTSTAVDLGVGGGDNTYGSGRITASVAAAAAGCTTDGDADGVLNSIDNCPTVANGPQTNTDAAAIATPGFPDDTTIAMSDRLGDACDADDDNDGIADSSEAAGCNASGALDPANADSDGDRIRDGAECVLGSNPGSALSKPGQQPDDTDHDGLPDALEAQLGSNANSPDSDGDGMLDGVEYGRYSTSPATTNSDGDGCPDDTEIVSVDSNTTVNVIDLLVVAQNAGTTALVPDIDKNGNVNVIDLLAVAQNVTSTGC